MTKKFDLALDPIRLRRIYFAGGVRFLGHGTTMLGSGKPVADAAREKVLRLVEFLARIALLRTKVVRSIDDYPKVLWVGDIPRLKGCFTQAWGPTEEYDSDAWVELQGRREPALPAVPPPCAEWVNKATLLNKSDLPPLHSEITRQVEDPKWTEGSEQPKYRLVQERLDDYPEIQREWNRYVDERWVPWTDDHNSWEKIHKVYSALFAIHQEQIRLGEEYELVLGLGLLTWQTTAGQRVRRHLIVADAILDFEARLKKFVVRPHPEGARLRPELDMLDVQEQPPHAEQAANAALAAGDDDPWEKACVEGVLQSLVHSISPQGEYGSGLTPSTGGPSIKPVVQFAPALILRKRTGRGLTETLKRIKLRIEAGEPIPCEFMDLAEIGGERSAEHVDDDAKVKVAFDGELFFPKPSNQEQRRIVDKLRSASGVLVQGPPGTGKSHTIASARPAIEFGR